MKPKRKPRPAEQTSVVGRTLYEWAAESACQYLRKRFPPQMFFWERQPEANQFVVSVCGILERMSDGINPDFKGTVINVCGAYLAGAEECGK